MKEGGDALRGYDFSETSSQPLEFLVDIGQEKLRRDHIEAFFRKYTSVVTTRPLESPTSFLIGVQLKFNFACFSMSRDKLDDQNILGTVSVTI